jgi:hypothetical protein
MRDGSGVDPLPTFLIGPGTEGMRAKGGVRETKLQTRHFDPSAVATPVLARAKQVADRGLAFGEAVEVAHARPTLRATLTRDAGGAGNIITVMSVMMRLSVTTRIRLARSSVAGGSTVRKLRDRGKWGYGNGPKSRL